MLLASSTLLGSLRPPATSPAEPPPVQPEECLLVGLRIPKLPVVGRIGDLLPL